MTTAIIFYCILIVLLFWCDVALTYIARLLVAIARDVREDNKRGVEHDKAFVGVIEDISGVNVQVSKSLNLFLEAVEQRLYILETAIRQGQTGPMTLRLEREERKARGEQVPELRERPRTVKENHLVDEVMRGQ